MGKIEGLPNLTFDSNAAVIDIQPSMSDSILVLINGALCIDADSPPLRFT